MAPEESVAICLEFIERKLLQEDWFKLVNEPTPKWSVIFLGGSTKYQLNNLSSDLDLFLVMKRCEQSRNGILPTYSYKFDGFNIEISQLSHELMTRVPNDRTLFFHWHAGVLLKSSSDQNTYLFECASNISTEEIRSLIWTRYVDFNIKLENIQTLQGIGDRLGMRLCAGDIAKGIAEAIMMCHGRFHTTRWLGLDIQKLSPDAYKVILDVLQEDVISSRTVQDLKSVWIDLLTSHGFSMAEVHKWDKFNLHRIQFQ